MAAQRIFPQELHYHFARILERRLKSKGVASLRAFVEDLVPELMREVPTAAFEPSTPQDRGVFFYHGEVDTERALEIQWDLESSQADVKPGIPFTVYLSTCGGSEEAGLAIVSTIQELQRAGREVNIHVQGGAYSMGSIILQAGSKRTIEPYGFLMIHDSSYTMQGKTPLHADTLDFLRRMDIACAELFAARTGKAADYYLKKWDRRDWYLSAAEALDEGLVDEIRTAPVYKRVRRKVS